MNLRRIAYIILSVIGIVGALLSLIMFVMAIRFGELGRVLVYFILAAVCTELAVYFILKLVPRDDKD